GSSVGLRRVHSGLDPSTRLPIQFPGSKDEACVSMNSVPTIPPAGQNNIWYQYTSSSAALVFVHGILSDSRSCWLHVDRHDGRKNVYWPELVRTDRRFGDPSIFLGGYYTAVDAGPYEVKDCAAELFSA